MIKVTDEMREAFNAAPAADDYCDCPTCLTHRLTAVLAIVDRDYVLGKRLTPEEIAALPKPKRRLRECVERWPGAEIEGDYDPRCCRWPKSCSASVYDPERVADQDLEPEL